MGERKDEMATSPLDAASVAAIAGGVNATAASPESGAARFDGDILSTIVSHVSSGDSQVSWALLGLFFIYRRRLEGCLAIVS